MLFEELNIIEPILKAIKAEGYTQPTPIQSQAIPIVLSKRDLLACAQTGTGKTAAFSVPILQLLHTAPVQSHSHKTPIRCLILTPTRELAIQIGESIDQYGKHTSIRNTVIFGGVNQTSQVHALQKGVSILVATPGRLLDLMNQGYIDLKQLQFFVLDEADRMLDMGFVHDVKKVIAKLPAKRQSLFFSATMPPVIQQLANQILSNPLKVEVTPVSSTAATIQQAVYFVEKADKRKLLLTVLQNADIERVLVFTRTKHGADRVAKDLVKSGIPAQAIHGNKSQNARQTALNNFKLKQTRVLVATDIAARGIDIEELTYVINFELPNIPESYVHRIGRSGRAGAAGNAISFCDTEERAYLKDIQKLIGLQIPVLETPAFEKDKNKPQTTTHTAPKSAGQRPNNNRKPKPVNTRGSNANSNPSPRRSGASGQVQATNEQQGKSKKPWYKSRKK